MSEHSNVEGLNELRVKVAGYCDIVFEHENDYVKIFVPTRRLVTRYFPNGDPQDTKDRLDLAGVPDYPNDLNACTALIDLLAGKGWTCQLNNGLDKTWECTFAKNSLPLQQHYAASDKLPTAICKAFIATMEGEKE